MHGSTAESQSCHAPPKTKYLKMLEMALPCTPSLTKRDGQARKAGWRHVVQRLQWVHVVALAVDENLHHREAERLCRYGHRLSGAGGNSCVEGG